MASAGGSAGVFGWEKSDFSEGCGAGYHAGYADTNTAPQQRQALRGSGFEQIQPVSRLKENGDQAVWAEPMALSIIFSMTLDENFWTDNC